MILPPNSTETSNERFHYILRYGVLGWGLATGILWSAVMTWWGPGPFLVYLAIALVLFPIGGWFWGAIMWRMIQRHRPGLPISKDTEA